jgi:ribonucleoside-diphosphate reductase alpha chain
METKSPRDHDLPSATQRIDSGWGKLYVSISYDDEGPFEVFVTSGPSGSIYNSQAEAIGKLASTALRMAEDRQECAEELAANLMGIRSDRLNYDNGDEVYSIPDAVGLALHRFNTGRMGEGVRNGEEEAAP